MAEPNEQREPADVAPDPAQAVSVAYVHQHEVAYSFHHSMVALLDHDMSHAAHVWAGGYTAVRGGTDGLASARNEAVKLYLTGERADWLWWVDTDMGFAPDTVDRLLDAADLVERPVMGALCFANYETDNDGMGGRLSVAAPVIMHWTHDGAEAGFEFRWDYPRDTVVRCDATGAACVLIHRSVFERVRDRYGAHWYSRAVNPSTGELMGEDMSFCARLMSLGIPVHVHTGVKTTHAKRMWLAEEDYWRQRALNAPPPAPTAKYLAARQREGWTVPRYAIVPTHNRPARLLALVASLGTQCDHIVVLDNASDPPVDEARLETAAGKALVRVIRDEEQPPNLARFWNIMFDACAEDARESEQDGWDVAVLNDDAVVPAGWYTACADGLRDNPKVAVAHTDPTTPALLTELHNITGNRMCPHAFVIRGEANTRADESMKWWYVDTDVDWRARQSGGVLSVPGPRVLNALANTTTRGVLAEQAEKDRQTFEAKWSR